MDPNSINTTQKRKSQWTCQQPQTQSQSEDIDKNQTHPEQNDETIEREFSEWIVVDSHEFNEYV